MKALLYSVIFFLHVMIIEGSFSRVVGGFEAPANFSKFHTSLQNLNGNHVCGGAVISIRHIVTAAHCVIDIYPEYIQVVVGTTNLDVGGLRYNVSSIKVHEDYDLHLKVNDIAVLKIKGSFDKEHVQIVNIYLGKLTEGDTVILSGFGAKEPNGETSRQMYALNLSVFNQDICKYAMRYVRDIHDDMFCTFTTIGEGTCHGDSGGPLVIGNRLVGIVSWGIPCAVGFPDVHTKVTSYIPWLKKQLCSCNNS
ncbi:chymotrypsin-2-like [Pectinophora gossypiella]|uniref:chymotrypsin-2-like n=1 Tax=Pectinophora gossypiella TaxID=13191 RepID=UPI00214E5F45|nr:chymotrypsin-2-like [Pectinophora gossypiella]XP_049871095.1 chymotrypsin-2-like [Pectinophora gossypiella]